MLCENENYFVDCEILEYWDTRIVFYNLSEYFNYLTQRNAGNAFTEYPGVISKAYA